MNLVNTHRGIIEGINGSTITISLRRGGTVRTTTDRKFAVGDVVCFTVDPVHLNITGIMLKSEADAIVRKANSKEEQIACMGIPDGLIIPETPDFGEEDPIESYYGKEVEDYDIDTLFGAGRVSEKHTGHGSREDRETLIDECDYFGDPSGD